MAAHLAGQGRAGLRHLGLDQGVARAPHQGRAAEARNLVETRLAGLDVGDNGGTGQILEHVPRQDGEQLIPPQHPAQGIDDADAVAIAVEGDPEVAFLGGDALFELLQVGLHGGVRVVGRKGAVDAFVEQNVPSRQVGAQHRQGVAGGAVARVPGHGQRLDRIEVAGQPCHVFLEYRAVEHLAAPRREGAGGRHPAQFLDGVGEKGPPLEDHLDAVVFGRVVGPCDHRPGVGGQRMGGVVQHRSRPQPDPQHLQAGSGQAVDEGRLQVQRTQSPVVADGDGAATFADDHGAESTADGTEVRRP